MLLAIGYLFLCLVIAGLGLEYKIGFWVGLLLCIITTPLIGLIIILASGRSYPKCKYCKFKPQTKENFCPACGKDAKGRTREEYQTQVIN